jgi:site-specific recombinase XerD
MIQEFLTYETKVKNLSSNTTDAYERHLKTFCGWLKSNGIARWGQVEKSTIDSYMAWLHDSSLKPATIRLHLASIRALYNYAIKQGYTKINPARYCESPKLAKRLPTTIKREGIEKAIANERTPLVTRLMIALLAETGIRIAELTALDCENIDLAEKRIRISGKGSKERIVYYGQHTASLLPGYMAGRTGQLFQGSEHCHRAIRHQIWLQLNEYAEGGQANPHALRHTYATTALNNGMPIESLQILLGHDNVETTRRYAKVSLAKVSQDYAQTMA